MSIDTTPWMLNRIAGNTVTAPGPIAWSNNGVVRLDWTGTTYDEPIIPIYNVVLAGPDRVIDVVLAVRAEEAISQANSRLDDWIVYGPPLDQLPAATTLPPGGSLSACPFCGGRAYPQIERGEHDVYHVSVRCTAPTCKGQSHPIGNLNLAYALRESIARWERRAP